MLTHWKRFCCLKDWGQKRETENEMVGWHHWLNGHEFEQNPEDSEGQRRLACCSPAAAAAKSLQSCLTLCDPVDGSPPGSSVPGILQARILEWVAISFSNMLQSMGSQRIRHNLATEPQQDTLARFPALGGVLATRPSGKSPMSSFCSRTPAVQELCSRWGSRTSQPYSPSRRAR